MERIISYINEDVEKIGICHILNHKEAEKLRDKLKVRFPQATIIIDELGPVVGSHLGPKAIGLCFY